MFAHVWRCAGSGATTDIEQSCASQAARERPAWTVLKCNVERALRGGVWKERLFSIIDVDCYGSPWRFLQGLFLHRRALADPCHLILTDHYMGNRNISHEDKTLGFRKPGTPDDYLARVDALLVKFISSQGWTYERKLYRDARAVQHLITLRRESAASETGE